MNNSDAANLALVRRYLDALAAGATGNELAEFFTPDAIQIELPNRLNPNGGTSDLATLLKRSEQGKHVLKSQRYDVRSEIASDSRAAVEALWTGVLAIPIGSLQPGATMRAHFGMFFEFENGRIKVQRNYDCFEPW